jgi:transposase
VATGEITGSIHRRHRATEFKKFLIKLDNQVPTDLDVHLICDNYATHKSPPIAKWLAAHPRFHMHFTPTYSSWLNQVERWFALLTDKQLRRGAHVGLRAGKGYPRLDHQLEQRSSTVRLDQDRR